MPGSAVRGVLLAGALMASFPLAAVAADRHCVGTASVFARAHQYLEVRVQRVASTSGLSCGLLEGQLHRVYFSRHSVRDRQQQEFWSRGGQALANKAPGYQFDFYYSISDNNGVVVRRWQLEAPAAR